MNNYSITLRNIDNKDQLIYRGELSFNHIKSIFSETESLIKLHSQAEIIIEDADLLDLSFVQMLISLKKTYHLKITLNLSEDLSDLIQVSGFTKYLIEEI